MANKMAKNGKKMAKNVRKLQIIVKFQKLLNMVTKWQQLTTMLNNVKKCQKTGQNGQKMAKFQILYFHRFSDSKLPTQMVLAVFTWCLVPEIRIFGHFWLKSAFLGLNSSRTKEITAKPMVLSYVGHFSKHWKQNPWSVFF